jgi:hypothetical protein
MTDKDRLALLTSAMSDLKQTLDGYDHFGGHWEHAWPKLERLAKDLKPKPKPSWGNVGPVTKPGASLLDYSLTHRTDGITLFPAVDLAWGSGVSLYAPESCIVDTKDTSASPGEALYMTGVSGLRYWIGHLENDLPLGKKLAKGSLIGRTAWQPNKKAHGHVGVNAEKYLGRGEQLKYGRTGHGPDYTTGSPRIRTQLLAAEL